MLSGTCLHLLHYYIKYLYFKTFDLSFDVEAAGGRDFNVFLVDTLQGHAIRIWVFLCVVVLENLFGALGCLCGP